MKQRSPPQLHLKRLPRLTKGERIKVFGLEQSGHGGIRDTWTLKTKENFVRSGDNENGEGGGI